MILDKTNYLNYLVCPRYGWQIFHKKLNLDEDRIRIDRSNQGYQVEDLAQDFFKGGYKINDNLQKGQDQTKKIVQEQLSDILYQATALSEDNLLAKADITLVNKDRSLDIYEVKAVNDVGFGKKKNAQKQEKYLNDVAFQKIAFEGSGFKINKVFLVHIDKNYVLETEVVDVNKFFTYIDISEDVDRACQEVVKEIKAAKACYQGEEPTCKCYLKSKGKRCETFYKFNPQIPDKDSIFDINRILINKIKLLYAKNILKIKDIDQTTIDEMGFNTKQLNHIQVVQTQKSITDKQAIAQRLDGLIKPLYFLDYESISLPIPFLKGASSYRQIVFQFSLHILKDNQEEPLHKEYLMRNDSKDELKILIENLKKAIGSKGSIIVWHKAAEEGFQNNLAHLFPETADFFQGLNERIFDLEKVFADQLYVHPDFSGKTSLKNVLPVLVPKLNYSDLNIQEGSLAGSFWNQALNEPLEAREKIFNDLLKYCQRDTLAMVEIYKFLNELIAN